MPIEALSSQPQFIPLEEIPLSRQPIGPVRSEGNSTISSASPSLDNQSTCCVGRCWTYVKSQMAQFCDWLCSFFSSKPVTVETLEATGKEMGALLDEKMPLLESAYREKYDVYFQAHGNSKDAVYCCFAHAIQLSNKVLQVVDIMEKWKAVTTVKEMESNKRAILQLILEIQGYSRTPIPPKCTPAIRALVEEDCLGREARRFLVASHSLYNQYVSITGEIRDSTIKKHQKDLNAMVDKLEQRYREISLDLIGTDSQALCCLADANKYCTLLTNVFEGDISERAVQAKFDQLSRGLKGPICTTMTPELEQALVECASSCESLKWDLAEGIAHQTRYPDQVKNRLQEVLDKIAKPVSTSVEVLNQDENERK